MDLTGDYTLRADKCVAKGRCMLLRAVKSPKARS
jgi:hypothetical protein